MSPTNLDPPRLWPASSLATQYGVDARWLIEEASAGRIPGVHAGRTWLFDPEAVEQALLERARKSVDSVEATDGKEASNDDAS